MITDFIIEDNEGDQVLKKYTGNSDSVIIPDNVTKIGRESFYNCTSLTSVVIPQGVKEIVERAFSGCTSLTSVVIPEGVTKIGPSAFSGCTSLTSILIPKTVREIGESVLEGCTSLISVVIPQGVKEIGRGAFSGCTSLTSVAIPQGVTAIDWGVFSGCTSLTSVVIPEEVTEIGWYAFAGCTSLTSVVIPEGVTEIGRNAFAGCTSLTSVMIPEGVKEIEWYAFRNCTSLTSIVIPEGVTKIGLESFAGCTSLTSVVIPQGVKEIVYKAFAGCTSLTSVVIPDSVIEIEDYAFTNCIALHDVKKSEKTSYKPHTFQGTPYIEEQSDFVIKKGQLVTFTGSSDTVFIPPEVVTIGESAFVGCSDLKLIVLPIGIKKIAGRDYDSHWETLELGIYYHHGKSELPEIVDFFNGTIALLDENRKVLARLFGDFDKDPYKEFLPKLMSGNIDNLSEFDELFSKNDEIVIHKTKTALMRLENSFELGESYRKKYVNYLQRHAHIIMSLLIKKGDIPMINDLANAGGLLPEFLDEYIEQASQESKMEILAILMDYKDKVGEPVAAKSLELLEPNPRDWISIENDDGTLTLIKYIGSSANIIIPAMINGKRVKRIEGWQLGSTIVSVFFHQREPKSVIIEEGIEEIGERAFVKSYGLSSIKIPKSVKMIGDNAFSGCAGLVFSGPKDSYAIEYAKREYIPYVEL